MQTDVVKPWQLEEGDVITLGGDATFTIAYFTDEGDHLSFVLTDEDGETDRENPLSFTADDDITLVVSLEDDEDIPDIE